MHLAASAFVIPWCFVIRHSAFAWLLLSFITSAFASPQPVWIKRYNAGPATGTNKPVAMALGSSGNVYIGGSATRGGTWDYVTLKYAPDGTLLWDAPYASPSNGVDEVRAMALDSAGNAYLTGTSATIRYDPYGNLMWAVPHAGRALAVDTNGNTYVTGLNTNDFVTAKVDPLGSNVWLRTYDGPVHKNDVAQAIALDPAGNIYVAGVEIWTTDHLGAYPRYALVKYDTNGIQEWVTGFPSTMSINPTGVKGLLAGLDRLYFAANLRSDLGKSFYTLRFSPAGSNVWAFNHVRHSEGSRAMAVDVQQSVYLTGNRPFEYVQHTKYETIKLNSDGQQQWISYYGADTGYHRANALALDSSKNVYVTGQSPEPDMGTNFVTVKYSPSGQELWVKRYNGEFNGDDVATGIAVDTNSGAIYVTGYSQTSSNLTEIVLIKYAELQNIQVQTNGYVFLQFFGNPGQNYAIHCTTNFQTWTNIATVTANPQGIYTYTDTNAPADPQRFYKTSGP